MKRKHQNCIIYFSGVVSINCRNSGQTKTFEWQIGLNYLHLTFLGHFLRARGREQRKWMACRRGYQWDTQCSKLLYVLSPLWSTSKPFAWNSYNLCFSGVCCSSSDASKQHVNHVCDSLDPHFSLSADDEPPLGMTSALCGVPLHWTPFVFPPGVTSTR